MHQPHAGIQRPAPTILRKKKVRLTFAPYLPRRGRVQRLSSTGLLDAMQRGYGFPLHSIDLRANICATLLDFAGGHQMWGDDRGATMYVLPPGFQAELYERRRCVVKFKSQSHNVPSLWFTTPSVD
jgi:hypothetical protein